MSIDIDILVIDDNKNNLARAQSTIELMTPIPFDGDEIIPRFHPCLARRTDTGKVDTQVIMEEMDRLRPGVAIVDMRLEGDAPDDVSGLDLSLRLKAAFTDCCIILRSAFFAQTKESEIYQNLEVFRDYVDTRQDGKNNLEEKITKALVTHASSLCYRNHRFRDLKNHGRGDMWGLLIDKAHNGIKIDNHLPLPQLKSNSVVVETIEIGVCGTNRAALSQMEARPYPLIDFHEAFGRVVWVGESVRDLRLGDYVVPMVRRCTPWDMPQDNEKITANSFAVHECGHKHHDCYGHPDECPVGEYIGQENGQRVGYKSFGTGKCHGFGSQYFVDTEEWLIKVDPPQDDEFRQLMMERYVLTEPLSIVWKARREILKHYPLREYEDEVLVVGLGPIGLLALLVMRKIHPGLRFTAVDLASPESRRVRLATELGNVVYHQAPSRQSPPEELKDRKFQIIIEATDDPDKIIKYGTELLSPSGIILLLGVSEDLGSVDLRSAAVTRFVKRNNVLIGSINSARSDFRDSIAFMEKVVGREESMLERMVSRWEIDSRRLNSELKEFGAEDRVTRQAIKVVLKAKEYTEQKAPK